MPPVYCTNVDLVFIVQVCYAGACYDENDKAALMHARRKLRGFQDTSLFPGRTLTRVELQTLLGNKVNIMFGSMIGYDEQEWEL
jgi:hypothetical protein